MSDIPNSVPKKAAAKRPISPEDQALVEQMNALKAKLKENREKRAAARKEARKNEIIVSFAVSNYLKRNVKSRAVKDLLEEIIKGDVTQEVKIAIQAWSEGRHGV